MTRRPEFTLALVALAGFVALAVATGGNLLSAGTLGAFFRFLAVPIVIGLSQMVVLAIGQMNLSVGVLTGFCAMVAAWLMIEAGLPAPIAVPGRARCSAWSSAWSTACWWSSPGSTASSSRSPP